MLVLKGLTSLVASSARILRTSGAPHRRGQRTFLPLSPARLRRTSAHALRQAISLQASVIVPCPGAPSVPLCFET